MRDFESLRVADDILRQGVQGISEQHGFRHHQRVTFADVEDHHGGRRLVP